MHIYTSGQHSLVKGLTTPLWKSIHLSNLLQTLIFPSPTNINCRRPLHLAASDCRPDTSVPPSVASSPFVSNYCIFPPYSSLHLLHISLSSHSPSLWLSQPPCCVAALLRHTMMSSLRSPMTLDKVVARLWPESEVEQPWMTLAVRSSMASRTSMIHPSLGQVVQHLVCKLRLDSPLCPWSQGNLASCNMGLVYP